MSSKATVRRREELAFSFVLEALTQGLYPNVFDVLREYVQNAYDALVKQYTRSKGDDCKIKVNLTGNSIFISDNGIGMTDQQVRQYRYVGFSEKRMGEAAGFRGIGKLSGISVADKLIVTSTTDGSDRRYQLAFDARAMLAEILALRAGGKNKPLNELIADNTEFSSEEASRKEHFTVVEIHDVRPEYRELLDPSRVRGRIGAVCPVPLNSEFRYEARVNEWLLQHVQDYYYFPHLVNDEPVYKPFTNKVADLRFFDIEQEEGGQPIAYAWACQNEDEGQLPESGPRGLVFRVKNIAIGDHKTCRALLWQASGHLAYWFLGEVHVIDPGVVPTAERSNFEDTAERQRLAERCRADLLPKLTKSARDSSAKANAEKKRKALHRMVENTETALQRREVPRESVVYEAAKLVNAMEAVESVKRRFPARKRKQVQKLIDRAKGVVDSMSAAQDFGAPESGVFDIKERLSLSDEEWRLYDVFVDFLRDFLADDPEAAATAIRRLQDRLMDVYGMQ